MARDRGGLDLVAAVTGEVAGIAAFLALVIGTTLTLLGLSFVMAATACALVELDEGRTIDATSAYRLAATRLRPLLGAIALFVVVWVVLTATAVLIPVAVWLAIRWSLLAPVVELEGGTGRSALRRSARLVGGRWLRVAGAGRRGRGRRAGDRSAPRRAPDLRHRGAAGAPEHRRRARLRVALPFVALVTSYVYFDARARHELEEEAPEELPAEFALRPS